MVLGEAVAGAAVGAHSLWSYNRDNYLFDRKMRQEQEFKILGYRNQQAKLWRQDIRDIVGLTEKKMDNYLIINTLQLAMCVGLFTEGRLEPGTPPWLMHFYMLTLGAAFMYLTISVWLAVHASVVAQCTSVRLLTQFVRLPIPTWKQLESIRTYASSFESLKMVDMLRMPFMSGCNASSQDAVDSVFADYLHKSSDNLSTDRHVTHGVTGTSAQGGTVDPWGLEENGASRSLYELQAKPAALRHHITLARRAAVQYQCYDGFARVAMTFGTNQLLNALTYYCLGYLSIQDGAPLPSACILVIMMSIASTLLQLDFSLTKREQFLLLWFLISGPSISCISVVAYLMDKHTRILVVLLPLAFASHGMFLGLALKSCGIKVQPNGAALPMKLRSVLYLDVFGWLSDRRVETGSVDECKNSMQSPRKSSMNAWACNDERARVCKLKEHSHQVTTADDESSCVGGGVSCCENEEQEVIPGGSLQVDTEDSTTWIHSQVRLATSPKKTALPVIEEASSSSNPETVGLLGNPSGEAVNSAITTAMQAAQNFSCLFHDEDEVQYELLRSESMDMKATTHDMSKTGMPGPSMKFDPSGAVPVAPATAFEPASYVHKEDCKGSVHTERIDEEVVTGHDRVRPGLLPSRIFRGATWLLIVSWTAGTGLPLSGRRDLWFEPQMKAELEELNKGTQGKHHHKASHTWVNRERWYSNEPLIQQQAPIPLLSGVLMSVRWPFDHGFVPRSISCDPSGLQLAVADDINIFTGQLGASQGLQSNPSLRRLQALDISFTRIPSCRALEGQALIDIGVICNLTSLQTCRVLVLHGTGRNISGCSMHTSNHSAMNENNMTWKISNGWLHNEYKKKHPEHILAAAMDRACLDGREDMKSCMVVGTSAGRIVQLREHLDDKHQLVPERAMQRRSDEVKPGSLHIYHTSFGAGVILSLQPHSHTIEAFTEDSGNMMGKWQLPATVTWLTLCGGGDFLYVAGIRQGTTEMYRFAIPDMIKSAVPG